MQTNHDESRNQIERQEDRINWRDFIEYHYHFRKWFVVSITIFLMAGSIFIMTQPPEFEFKTVILIKDPNNSNQELTLTRASAKRKLRARVLNYVNNEEIVIRSGQLMQRLVRELKLYTQYSVRENLHFQEIYRNSPYEVELIDVALNHLQGELRLRIAFDGKEYRIQGEYQREKFEYMVKILPQIITTPAGKLNIKQNPESPFSKEKIYVRICSPFLVEQELTGGGIRTEINEKSDDIAIYYKTGNEAKGKDVLNTLINLYNRLSIEQVNQTSVNTSYFLNKRLRVLSSELREVELELEINKKTHLITDFRENAELIQREKSKNYDDLVNTDIQIQQLNAIYNRLINDKENKGLVPALEMNNPGLRNIIAGYNQLVLKKNNQIATDKNPVFISLNRQIIVAKTAILDYLQNSLQVLRLEKTEMLKQNIFTKRKFFDLPGQERELAEISRYQQVKSNQYLYLLKKMEETSLSLATATNKARLLNPPATTGYESPDILLILVVFLLSGMLAPVSVLYLIRKMNHTITNRADVESLTYVHILAELAHEEINNQFIDHTGNSGVNAELFRLLRSKLFKIMHESGDKTILITSTEPGEGKTMISLNLAISLSLTDKKVLLMGMDLRKPMLAKYFGLKEQEGISSYLAGTLKDTGEIIFQSADFSNLHIMPAGIIPPNPNELIQRDKLEELLVQLKENYDFIIIDSAPVGVVSDTMMISRVSDVTLYITRANYTGKRNLEFLNRLYKENLFKQLYVILNDSDIQYPGYGNKYGYGNRYGYGHDNKIQNKSGV